MVERATDRPTATSDSDIDLGSYEGKFPADLFNKSVVIEEAGETRTVGRVQMEGQDTIVVFGDSGDDRYDIPKSDVTLAGDSLVIAKGKNLSGYQVSKEAPLPPAKSLRASAEEIRQVAREQVEIEKARQTRADAVLSEYNDLTQRPRPETSLVVRPENYVDDESELSKKIKAYAAELKELLYAGTRVAKHKAKVAKRKVDEKRAQRDAESISKMGDLAPRFTDSFDEILSEVGARPYAEQEQIYNGFLRLIDSQRDLVAARRDMAARIKDTVPQPTRSTKRRRLTQRVQPALPEKIDEDSTLAGRSNRSVKSRTVESP